jgi:hypothetical protein
MDMAMVMDTAGAIVAAAAITTAGVAGVITAGTGATIMAGGIIAIGADDHQRTGRLPIALAAFPDGLSPSQIIGAIAEALLP